MSIRTTALRHITRLATGTPMMRKVSRRLLHRRRSLGYRAACRRTTVDPRVVVFECYAGRSYTCSPRALYQRMLESEGFDGFEFVWVLRRDDIALLRDPDPRLAFERFGDDALSELQRAAIVEFGSAKYQEAYARAGTWVSNYILPSHLRARTGQRYLQTWHGTPLKRLGCDITGDKRSAMFDVAEIHERYRTEGERFTWLVSPSPFATEKLGDAFALSSDRRAAAVIESGYPRNDALARPDAEQTGQIRERIGIPEDRQVVLYAPTFRDDEHAAGIGYTFSHLPDFDLLKEHLGDTHTVLFRGHYLLAEEFDFQRYGGFVIDASAVSEINDLYLVSDILVTDYSSVFFDYANLQRPIVFYMQDLERYRSELRGFYLDLGELPGPVTHTTAELLEAIRAQGKPDSGRTERLNEFRTRFAPLDDGNAAARVLERALHAMTTGQVSPSGDNPGHDVL